jgi:hypothetical protein
MEFFNRSTKSSDGTAGFVSFELRNDESLARRALSSRGSAQIFISLPTHTLYTD